MSATRIIDTVDGLPLSMRVIADLLLSSTSATDPRDEAISMSSTSVHDDVRSHDRLALTSLDLTVILADYAGHGGVSRARSLDEPRRSVAHPSVFQY